MANHFRLYERPLMTDETQAELSVTGVLEGYVSGDAYEGRLQINNSIGRCTVEIVEANLPPGAAVRVDNITKEVVVKWDAFEEAAEESNSVPNGDFEEGDNGQWILGNGWSIEAGGAETGTFSAVFQNFRGISNIESVRFPYTPGTPITGQCRFQQGASSENKLTGRALLIWCDINGNALPGGEGVSFTGGELIRSGKNGEWKPATVTGASREAVKVAIGFSCNRRSQNRLARVDNFTWNHKYTVGTQGPGIFHLSIRVTDSENRVAFWDGVIYMPDSGVSTWVAGGETSVDVPTPADLSLGGIWIEKADATSPLNIHITADGIICRRFEGSSRSLLPSDVRFSKTRVSTNATASGILHRGIAIKKRPGVMDIVEYVGTGAAHDIPHSLGSVPGVVLILGDSCVLAYNRLMGTELLGGDTG